MPTPRSAPLTPRSPFKRPRHSSLGGGKGTSRGTVLRIVGIICVLGACVALGVGLGVGLTRKNVAAVALKPSNTLTVEYCQQLQSPASSACATYVNAAHVDKFTAATAWREASESSYSCAGISQSCLIADQQRNNPGSTCEPLANGATCDPSGRTCSKGYCGDSTASATAPKVTTPEEEQDLINAQLSKVPASPPTLTQAVRANPAWGNFSAVIDPTAMGTRVPKNFLGTSHEWTRITDWAANLQAFANIFTSMGPGAILRIGGATQDLLVTAPPKETWDTLLKLHKAANVRFLIGLPMWQPNAFQLSSEIMATAQRVLPAEALVGFELGNEPEFWPTGLGGYTQGSDPQWQSGFEAYAAYFERLAMQLNPCTANGPKPLLAGPGWGNVNTQDFEWFRRILNPGRCYMRESSVHYYPYVQNTTIDARGLLAQDLQDFGLDKFRMLKGISDAYKLPLRISETNSLYGGGRTGFSETMVGTIWGVDALFAFANAGASGFHFHWGVGGVPRDGGPANVGVQTNFDKDGKPYPSVHAPWFGYLMFIDASAGGKTTPADTNFVRVTPSQGSCRGNVKVYGLLADGGELRAALLNKDVSATCNMEVVVPKAFCGNATLDMLLPGKEGMASKAGITWKGQQYIDPSGKIGGTQVMSPMLSVARKDGSCSYTVPMPAASGAVLRMPQKKTSSTATR